MKVGIDATVLHGQYSGVENAVRGLILALAADPDANQYTLFCGNSTPFHDPLPPRFQWAHQSFPASNKLRRVLFQQRSLPRISAGLGLQVLHGPAYVTPIRPRTPTVASVYDLMVLVHPSMCDRPNRLHYRYVLPRSLRACRRVIVPSTATKESLVRYLRIPEERIVLAPLGLDPAFSAVTAEEACADRVAALGLPEGYILFVGNIEPKKGLDVLLRALAYARERCAYRRPLVIVGRRAWGASDVDRLIAELRLADQVHLAGYVASDLLPDVYALARTFVFPSLYEGFGLPPLEAMACGTPVVTSDGGALPETVGDAAVVVPAGSVEALAEGIIRTSENEELRADLRSRGRQRVGTYSWREHARIVRRVYEEVGGGG